MVLHMGKTAKKGLCPNISVDSIIFKGILISVFHILFTFLHSYCKEVHKKAKKVNVLVCSTMRRKTKRITMFLHLNQIWSTWGFQCCSLSSRWDNYSCTLSSLWEYFSLLCCTSLPFCLTFLLEVTVQADSELLQSKYYIR